VTVKVKKQSKKIIKNEEGKNVKVEEDVSGTGSSKYSHRKVE
jgi:hypothetical protein